MKLFWSNINKLSFVQRSANHFSRLGTVQMHRNGVELLMNKCLQAHICAVVPLEQLSDLMVQLEIISTFKNLSNF